MADAIIPGLAVAAVRDGRVTFARGYGFADIDAGRAATKSTPFHVASVTKLLTGSAIMQLVDRGALDLDAPLSDVLDFELRHPAHPQAPITARHLLTHCSGISDEKLYAVDFRVKGGDSSIALRDFLVSYLVPGGARARLATRGPTATSASHY